ncbi:SLBB domain-containing protein [Synechococcus sp. BL107]|uniref:SLBB domain-containing protein n=1 Tax=Synechococcus sp. BL107 TaxID=313625 RepID=UPI0003184472|nr:SLBB domain-containing protein [Synechococcus sp. BL107]
MSLILRSGLSAGMVVAWMLTLSSLGVGAARSEERRNWLKVPERSVKTVEPAAAPISRFTATSYRYRLAPGDQLVMSVFKIEGYEAKVEVLSDGTINLPRLGTVLVWGLTLEEARQKITKGYRQILRRPIVYLDLARQRPIRVTVTGEVERPGIYTLQVNASKADIDQGLGSGGGWPTLVDVIARAGGITAVGDLSSLELMRPSYTNGGQSKRYKFDYLTVLKNGGHAPNPLIYDGDSVRVVRADSPTTTDLIAGSISNFSPALIQVAVIGEVKSPGSIQVPPNSPLAAAVLKAGGIEPIRGSIARVAVIRTERDGSTSVKKMTYSPDALLSNPNNPPLRQGDIVVVDRNVRTQITDGMNAALEPLNPIVNAMSIFRVLGLPSPFGTEN